MRAAAGKSVRSRRGAPTGRRWLLVPFAAAAAATFAAAAPSCTSDAPRTPAPDVGAPIVIGASIALTNDLAGRGKILQNAIRVAEQQINANGGVLGRRVVVHVVDDASDRGALLEGNVRKLLDEGVAALLGPIGSAQVKLAAPLAAERKIIELTATATSAELSELEGQRTRADRFLFRTVPSDTLQGKALAVFAARGPADASDDADAGASDAGRDAGDAGAPTPGAGCRKMAIVHNDDAYGAPFATALTAEFTRLGGTVAVTRSVASEAVASYQAEVSAIVDARPECLAIITFSPAAAAIVREVRAAQRANPGAFPAKFFIVGTDGSYRSDLIRDGRDNKADPSSPTVVDGMYGTNPDPNPETPEYAEFKNLYLAQFGLEPGQSDLGFGVAGIYDATILVALAIEHARGTDDPIAVRDALFTVSRGGRRYGPLQLGEALEAVRNGQDVDYNGASGNLDFDDRGDVIANYIVWKVEGAEFKTVERIRASELSVP